MKKPVRRKRTIEFSKWILIAVSVLVFSIVGFSAFMIYITKDLSPLAYLIPAIFAEAGTATAFYYNKAKAEAQVKLKHYLEKEAVTDEQDRLGG